jgi:glyoxylase-like metal-dependent hydrolase (beta-lactamase superfamily II)
MGIVGARLRTRALICCVAASFLADATLQAQQRAQTPAQPPAARAQAPAAAPLVRENTTRKIAPHTWVIPDNSVPFVPNVGIVVGSRATLVIDPGLGVRNGQAVLREVAKISKNAEMYVVTTHFHPEHAAGVAAFPASAKYIVSQVQQKDLDELAPAMAAQFAKRTPLMGELLKNATFRKADISFDKQYELDLGGVKVTLMTVGPTHTRGDTVAWVQDEKAGVIFAGDVIMNQTIVAYGQYSSTKAWMDALAQLARLRPAEQEDPAIVVPSHGAVGNSNLIAYERGFFQGIQARVRELKDQGKSEPEILMSVTDEFKGRYAMWNATDRIAAIVSNVYQEMR